MPSVLITKANVALQVAAGVRAAASDLVAPTGSAASAQSEARDLERPRIAIVDDEPIIVATVRKYLSQAGFAECIATSDACQAISLLREHRPDLLLLDIVMPRFSGLEILQEKGRCPELSEIPVIVLSASGDRDTRLAALRYGATDFLEKPVEPVELIPRVKSVLSAKAYQEHLRNFAHNLEQKVAQRTAELAQAQDELIACLARASDFRDDETGKHVKRVGRFVEIIALQLGLDGGLAAEIGQAAKLHDIGKIGIPDAILHKPGRFTPEEMELMRKHCQFGHDIMLPALAADELAGEAQRESGSWLPGRGKSSILRLAGRIALSHHERWDGQGYPLGLAGEDIPLEGRITAVADVYDALSNERPYKRAFSPEKCFATLTQDRGSHFDPAVIDAFLDASEQVLQVQEYLSESRGEESPAPWPMPIG